MFRTYAHFLCFCHCHCHFGHFVITFFFCYRIFLQNLYSPFLTSDSFRWIFRPAQPVVEIPINNSDMIWQNINNSIKEFHAMATTFVLLWWQSLLCWCWCWCRFDSLCLSAFTNFLIWCRYNGFAENKYNLSKWLQHIYASIKVKPNLVSFFKCKLGHFLNNKNYLTLFFRKKVEMWWHSIKHWNISMW